MNTRGTVEARAGDDIMLDVEKGPGLVGGQTFDVEHEDRKVVAIHVVAVKPDPFDGGQPGLDDPAYVIYTSDNGAAPGEIATTNAPLAQGKGTLFEGGVRVPFVVRGPDIATGAVSSYHSVWIWCSSTCSSFTGRKVSRPTLSSTLATAMSRRARLWSICGVKWRPAVGAAAVFGDVDGDDDLDIFVANGTSGARGGPDAFQNRLWINDGTGIFTDETATQLPFAAEKG